MTRRVVFSITIFEVVGEDTIDMGDAEIELVFTGGIKPISCALEMARALHHVKKKKLITGKLVDVNVCT